MALGILEVDPIHLQNYILALTGIVVAIYTIVTSKIYKSMLEQNFSLRRQLEILEASSQLQASQIFQASEPEFLWDRIGSDKGNQRCAFSLKNAGSPIFQISLQPLKKDECWSYKIDHNTLQTGERTRVELEDPYNHHPALIYCFEIVYFTKLRQERRQTFILHPDQRVPDLLTR